MKIIAFIEDYKVANKILDRLGIYEYERKRLPPRAAENSAEFYKYIIGDYADTDHIC